MKLQAKYADKGAVIFLVLSLVMTLATLGNFINVFGFVTFYSLWVNTSGLAPAFCWKPVGFLA